MNKDEEIELGARALVRRTKREKFFERLGNEAALLEGHDPHQRHGLDQFVQTIPRDATVGQMYAKNLAWLADQLKLLGIDVPGDDTAPHAVKGSCTTAELMDRVKLPEKKEG